MEETKSQNEIRHKSDQESIAISLCVSAIEPLNAEQTARVLRYVGERYLEKLKVARLELDAKIKIVEQHARHDACELCRSLQSTEIVAEIGATQ